MNHPYMPTQTFDNCACTFDNLIHAYICLHKPMHALRTLHAARHILTTLCMPMDPLTTLCVPMGPLTTLCVPMDPLTTLCVPMDPLTTLCVLICAYAGPHVPMSLRAYTYAHLRILDILNAPTTSNQSTYETSSVNVRHFF